MSPKARLAVAVFVWVVFCLSADVVAAYTLRQGSVLAGFAIGVVGFYVATLVYRILGALV